MEESRILDKDSVRLLLDVGFAACSRGVVAEAKRIFDGVLAAFPDNVSARVGRAFVLVVTDQFTGAEEILNDILEQDPGNDDARGFLALSKYLQKDSDALGEQMTRFADTASSGYCLAASLLEG